MNALVILVIVAAAMLAFAVTLDCVRKRRARAAGEWDHPDVAQYVIGVIALAAALVGAMALPHAHTATASTVTSQVTLPLVESSDGVYLTAQGQTARSLSFKTPDEDGWVQDRKVQFTDAVVRAGLTAEVTITTETAPGGFLWPWDTVAKEAYTFTVPADGVSGLVLDSVE